MLHNRFWYHNTHSPLLLEASKPYETLDIPNEEGNSPLHMAVILGDFNTANSLLTQQKVNPNTRNHQQQTPLHIALAALSQLDYHDYGLSVIISSLLTHDADYTLLDCNNRSPLDLFIALVNEHRSHFIIDLLPLFIKAIIKKEDCTSLERLKGVLNVGNLQDCYSRTFPNIVLCTDINTILGYIGNAMAAETGAFAVSQWLLNTGMITKNKMRDPISDAGDSVFHLAAQYGHVDYIFSLLKYGYFNQEDIRNHRNIRGHTVLHKIAIGGHVPLIQRLLLENRVSKNELIIQRKTLVSLALTNYNPHFLQWLLDENIVTADNISHQNPQLMDHRHVKKTTNSRDVLSHAAWLRRTGIGTLNLIPHQYLRESLLNGIAHYGFIDFPLGLPDTLLQEIDFTPPELSNLIKTFLITASNSNIPFAEWLLKKHFFTKQNARNAVNDSGLNAMQIAAKEGQTAFICWLLNAGIFSKEECNRMEDGKGFSLITIAAQNKHYYLISWLLTHELALPFRLSSFISNNTQPFDNIPFAHWFKTWALSTLARFPAVAPENSEFQIQGMADEHLVYIDRCHHYFPSFISQDDCAMAKINTLLHYQRYIHLKRACDDALFFTNTKPRDLAAITMAELIYTGTIELDDEGKMLEGLTPLDTLTKEERLLCRYDRAIHAYPYVIASNSDETQWLRHRLDCSLADRIALTEQEAHDPLWSPTALECFIDYTLKLAARCHTETDIHHFPSSTIIERLFIRQSEQSKRWLHIVKTGNNIPSPPEEVPTPNKFKLSSR